MVMDLARAAAVADAMGVDDLSAINAVLLAEGRDETGVESAFLQNDVQPHYPLAWKKNSAKGPDT